jgi:hypothetical protein
MGVVRSKNKIKREDIKPGILFAIFPLVLLVTSWDCSDILWNQESYNKSHKTQLNLVFLPFLQGPSKEGISFLRLFWVYV